jgi:hypothetical protein
MVSSGELIDCLIRTTTQPFGGTKPTEFATTTRLHDEVFSRRCRRAHLIWCRTAAAATALAHENRQATDRAPTA